MDNDSVKELVDKIKSLGANPPPGYWLSDAEDIGYRKAMFDAEIVILEAWQESNK